MSNLAISIDVSKHIVRLLHTKNNLPIYKEINFSPNCIDDNGIVYEQIISQVIAPYVYDKENKISSVCLVMDDSFVFCDYIQIPAFIRRKKVQTINIEIAKRYNNIDSFTYRVKEIYSDKTKIAYSVFMANNLALSRISLALNKLKIPHKITFSSACIANSLKHLYNSNQAPTLFAYIQDYDISLILCNNDLIAFSKQVTTNTCNLVQILNKTCVDLAVYFGFEHINLKVVCKASNTFYKFDNSQLDIVNLSSLSLNNVDLWGAIKMQKNKKGLLF